jgi:hypothetical protein
MYYYRAYPLGVTIELYVGNVKSIIFAIILKS